MNCPLCETKMTADVELTGGCGCYQSGSERCYCDSPEVNVKFVCPKNVPWEYVDGQHRRPKNPCKQKPLSIGELSDSGSIGRWLTEHYVPTPGSTIF